MKMVRQHSRHKIICLIALLFMVFVAVWSNLISSKQASAHIAYSSGWAQDCDGYGKPVYKWDGITDPSGLQVCSGTGKTGINNGPRYGNGAEVDEFQCTELVMRYLWMQFGFPSLASTNGDQIVNHYSWAHPDKLHAINNDSRMATMKMVPIKGDVLSFNEVHTAIVTDSYVNSKGNGSISIIQQNVYVSGNLVATQSIPVSNWIIGTQPFTGYTVKNWMTPRSSPGYPGGWIIGPTPTGAVFDGNGNVSQANPISAGTQIDLGFQAVDNNNGGIKTVNFTKSTDNGKTWSVIPNDYIKTGGSIPTGQVQYFAHFFMANTPVILGFDPYSINGNYQLSPNGLRYLCTNSACPTQLMVYTGPSIGGGGDPNPTPPGPNDAIELCQQANFSGDCERFTYAGQNDQCQSLDQMAGNSDSLHFLGNYKGNYHLDLFHDNNCETFLSAVDGDISDFKLLKNQYVSMKINYTGAALNGYQICEQANYGGNCEMFHYSANDQCIYLDQVAGKEDSLRFQGSYISSFGLYNAVMYHDNSCGTYLARYDHDVTDLGQYLKNQFSSMRLEKMRIPDPPDGFQATVNGNNVHLSWNSGGQSQIHIWGDNYDLWKIWQNDHALDLHNLSAGTYSVQVQSQNPLGTSAWGDVWTFTITDTSSSLTSTWIEPTSDYFVYEPGIWYNLQMKVVSSFPFDHLTFYGIWDSQWHDLCGAYPQQENDSIYSCSRDFRWANNNTYPSAGDLDFVVQVVDQDGAIRTPSDWYRAGTYKESTLGGSWNAPNDGFTLHTGDSLHLSAEAFPGNNHPAIDHVEFKASWDFGQNWTIVCSTDRPSFDPHEYACDWDTSVSNIPPNTQVVLTFAVFEGDGGTSLDNPGGTLVGTYEPIQPTPTPIPSPSPTPKPTSANYTGQYYANQTLAGTPKFTRNDAAVNFNWGKGSPGKSIPSDHFSVRWTQTTTLAVGTYLFSITSDDGARLYIDGKLVINQWRDHGAITYTITRTLAQGKHTIKLEYYENVGYALAKLTYRKIA